MKAEKGAAPASSPLPKGPNCWECRYLAITWDVRKPYACNFMGFKSRAIPSLEVLRNDGRFCGAFSAKPRSASDNKSKNGAADAVGKPSKRQDSDFQNQYIPTNLTT